MKLLLDSNVLFWWSVGDPRLGAAARTAIADERNVILYSVASPWELAIKVGLRRLNLDVPAAMTAFADSGFVMLSATPQHIAALVALELIHRDPFDRMIVAQAIVEGATVMTTDRTIPRYPVRTIGCD